MDPNEIVKLIVIMSVIAVPAIGITARFALKPIVDSIIRLREAFVDTSHAHIENEEIRQLRYDVHELKESVKQLHDVVDFNRQLKPPQS